MPSGQFYTVVISVSDILPLDKGHYISVMLDKRIELSEKVKGLVFHMKETQTVVAPGYYSYNFETFLYNYIGKDLP